MKLNLAAAVLMVAALVGGFLVLRTGLYPGSAGSPQTAVYLFGMAPNDASQPVAYALDPSTGSTVWQQNVDKNRIGNASVVANGSIYYSSSDGTISALNARNGQPLWHTKLTPDQTPPALVSFSGGPLAYGNLLIVTTTSGDLYALKASTGTISWKNTIQGCSAPDNQWGSSPLTQTAPLPSTACTLFSMVQSNGILYGLVGTHSSVNRHLAGLYAWDETDGHALWHNPQYVATGPALTPIVASPRKIYLPSNENSVNVFSGIDVLDASTGQFLHHLQTGSPINEMIAPDATTLYALDGNNMLSAYRLSDETLLWQKYTAPLISEMSVTNDNVYLVSSNQAYSHATDLFTLRSRTGDQLWRWHGSQEGAAAPIEVNGVVCMSTTDGVYAFQFDTGHLLWHFPGAGMYEMISG